MYVVHVQNEPACVEEHVLRDVVAAPYVSIFHQTYGALHVRVRLKIIRNARIKNVGKYG